MEVLVIGMINVEKCHCNLSGNIDVTKFLVFMLVSRGMLCRTYKYLCYLSIAEVFSVRKPGECKHHVDFLCSDAFGRSLINVIIDV